MPPDLNSVGSPSAWAILLAAAGFSHTTRVYITLQEFGRPVHINSILLLHFNRESYSHLLWASASSLSFLRDVAIFYDEKKKRVQVVGEIDSCLKCVYVYMCIQYCRPSS